MFLLCPLSSMDNVKKGLDFSHLLPSISHEYLAYLGFGRVFIPCESGVQYLTAVSDHSWRCFSNLRLRYLILSRDVHKRHSRKPPVAENLFYKRKNLQ